VRFGANQMQIVSNLAVLDKSCEKKYHHCRYIWRDGVKTSVKKWGNSLALRIPRSFAAEAGLEKETPVEISLADGKLVITPIVEPGATLAQLLAQITPDNLHGEVDTGPAAGKEIW
jgi:antitoxin MazE